MLKEKKVFLRFLCNLSYLCGCAIGTAAGIICSERAFYYQHLRVLSWYSAHEPYAGFAGHLLVVLLMLLSSASTIGFVFIPLLVFLYGLILSLFVFLMLAKDSLSMSVLIVLPALAAAIPIIRLSALCSQMSLHFTGLYISRGKNCFDLRPINNGIWLSLLILFILLLLRCMLRLFSI